MKLDEAIKLKEQQLNDPYLTPKGKLAEADRLSIEALKEYQKLKLTPFLPIGYKLPGETS